MKKIEIPKTFKIKSVELDDRQMADVLFDCVNAINELIDLQNKKVEPEEPECTHCDDERMCRKCHNPTKIVDENPLNKYDFVIINGRKFKLLEEE